jgi:hypothetical protein
VGPLEQAQPADVDGRQAGPVDRQPDRAQDALHFVATQDERACQVLLGPPDVLAAVERFGSMVQTNRDQLAAYLKDSAGGNPSGETTTSQSTLAAAAEASAVLRDLCLAFNHCVISYAILHEMALRLYEPRLREIAPKHLKAYADAALSATRLLPTVVAWQLAQGGLHCSCIARCAASVRAAAWHSAPKPRSPPGATQPRPNQRQTASSSKLPGRRVSWRRPGCKAESDSSPSMVNPFGLLQIFRPPSASTHSGMSSGFWYDYPKP